MKAEDLMIGDWVIRKGVPEEPMRLYDMKASAGNAYLDQDGRGVTEKFENIEPIVLTEEILEKNNFQSKEDPYNHRKFFFLGKNEYDLDVYLDNKSIILIESYYEPTVYAYMCDCEYVHQFQHILKDLKINREIKL